MMKLPPREAKSSSNSPARAMISVSRPRSPLTLFQEMPTWMICLPRTGRKTTRRGESVSVLPAAGQVNRIVPIGVFGPVVDVLSE